MALAALCQKSDIVANATTCVPVITGQPPTRSVTPCRTQAGPAAAVVYTPPAAKTGASRKGTGRASATWWLPKPCRNLGLHRPLDCILESVDQASKLHSRERMGLAPMATWADVGLPSDYDTRLQDGGARARRGISARRLMVDYIFLTPRIGVAQQQGRAGQVCLEESAAAAASGLGRSRSPSAKKPWVSTTQRSDCTRHRFCGH